jgi:hypothetical protein
MFELIKRLLHIQPDNSTVIKPISYYNDKKIKKYAKLYNIKNISTKTSKQLVKEIIIKMNHEKRSLTHF